MFWIHGVCNHGVGRGRNFVIRSREIYRVRVGGRDTKKRNAVTPLMLKLWRLVGLLGSEEIESKQYAFSVTYVHCKYLADLVCLFKHSSSEQREKNFAWDGGDHCFWISVRWYFSVESSLNFSYIYIYISIVLYIHHKCYSIGIDSLN